MFGAKYSACCPVPEPTSKTLLLLLKALVNKANIGDLLFSQAWEKGLFMIYYSNYYLNYC
jgi:hypothetical protein